jgi:hypothetical protein
LAGAGYQELAPAPKGIIMDSIAWIGVTFILGLMIGTLFGIFVMSLCHVAAGADVHIDRMEVPHG